jgi:4-hydroxybenzoate polyprenyltransferase
LTPLPDAADQLPDAPQQNWVDRFAAPSLRPYLRLARLDRPIGWWLLFLPCWWSAALAGIAQYRAGPNFLHVLLCLFGAITMRAAGCVYNDMIDRDLDKKVARTRNRPLASGAVSVPQALILLVGLSLTGLFILTRFNTYTIWVGLCSLLPIAVYPFMKRITSWPQAVLGLAFAWGGLVGWTAATETLTLEAVMIYIAAVFWTIGYDTVYAIQDFDDDSIAGIRSTPRLFGAATRKMVAIFYGLALFCLSIAYQLVDTGPLAWLGLLGFGAHLAWQINQIDLKNPQIALKLFRSNRDAGLILALSLSLDPLSRLL